MSTTIKRPILISGGGLASLLLARSLLRSEIPFQLFEQDKDISFRAQGYRLRLSPEGLDAIEEVLGPDGFSKFYERCSKTGGAGFAAIDAVSGKQTEQAAPQPLSSREGKVVGISRGDMRQLFLEGCEEFVHWGKRVTAYEDTENGGVKAVFADGTTSVEGDMLICGEGVKSITAKQVSQGLLKVYDTGARGIHGQARTPAFKGLGGEGVFMLRDTSREKPVFVITNVRPGEMDDPEVVFGWTMGGGPGLIEAPNDNYTVIGKAAADIAKSLTRDWDSKLKPLFDDMIEEDAAFWKITISTPEGVPQWDNHPRVTAIGDAVHSMTPAGGIGANTAVRDSALLGKLLGEKGGWWDGVTKEYEEKMKVYANEAVKSSWAGAQAQWGLGELDKSKTI